MQPFAFFGIPRPDECLGTIGILVSVVLAIVGFAIVGFSGGSLLGFSLLAVAVVLGISSFMYCLKWGASGGRPP